MTTLLDPAARPAAAPAARLRLATAAVRVSFTWLGVRKALSPAQQSRAAEAFDAEGEFLSARKKLLDTKHPAYRGVTAVRGRVLAFWKGLTLPYPEPGVRLMRQEQVEPFHAEMTGFRDQLDEAVSRLDEHYAELQRAARRRLGALYDEADYPPQLRGLFGLDWDFPAVEPPAYLLELSPALYEQERARVAGRFEEAVRLAEEAFVGELAKLVTHLTERLTGPDGERKVFRDSAVGNLQEFLDRFARLSVRSSPELDALVTEARRAVAGVGPQQLRDSSSLRQHVATHLAQVQTALDGMLVERPRRRIVRAAPEASA